MSRIISYKGKIAIGLQDRIRLRTLNGKVGYKINKFELISSTPGAADSEFVGKITRVKDPNIGPTVNFTDADLLAVNYTAFAQVYNTPVAQQIIILDNEKFNQDIFVNITDASSNTVPCNYYIELETLDLSDLETTMMTLQSIRSITSR